MTSSTLATMRKTLQDDLKEAQEAVDRLRAQRAEIQNQIKVKVTERDELRSALARLTPRKGKRHAARGTEPTTQAPQAADV